MDSPHLGNQGAEFLRELLNKLSCYIAMLYKTNETGTVILIKRLHLALDFLILRDLIILLSATLDGFLHLIQPPLKQDKTLKFMSVSRKLFWSACSTAWQPKNPLSVTVKTVHGAKRITVTLVFKNSFHFPNDCIYSHKGTQCA